MANKPLSLRESWYSHPPTICALCRHEVYRGRFAVCGEHHVDGVLSPTDTCGYFEERRRLCETKPT